MGESSLGNHFNLPAIIRKMIKVFSLIYSRITQNPFFIGSLIMVVGSNIFNVGQFVFHIIAARILGRAYYGDLAALVNILGIFALIQISVGLAIVKFVASEKRETNKRGLIQWAVKWSLFIGILVCILIIVFANKISSFLNLLQLGSVYVLAPIILFYSVIGISRSVLQGLLKFGWHVGSLFAEVSVKLLLVFPFILAGYAVIGALGALLIGALAAFIVVIYPLREIILGPAGQKPLLTPILRYSLPAFLQGIALISMYSTDLFLVKHFFTPDAAGLYAALAKLGTIVFFGASPVIHVMFPLVAKKHAHGRSYHKIFYLSLLLVSLIASFVILLYYFFPVIFLSALGANFLEGAGALWWFGVFMGLLVIATLFVQFYLSVGKTRVVGLFLAGATLQATLILFFHSSLLQVVQMSIIAASLLVLALLIYFPYHDRK